VLLRRNIANSLAREPRGVGYDKKAKRYIGGDDSCEYPT